MSGIEQSSLVSFNARTPIGLSHINILSSSICFDRLLILRLQNRIEVCFAKIAFARRV